MKHRKLFLPFTDTNCSGFCNSLCPQYCLSPPPPPPFTAEKNSNSNSTQNHHHLSPYAIVLGSFLAGFFLLACYYVIIARFCGGWSRRNNNGSESGNSDEEFIDENRFHHPVWFKEPVGLQQSVINSISVEKYQKGEKLIEGTECSVCLNEFQEEEMLRLLPKCNHAFHIPCIDTWLRSHINCPLCRAGIVFEVRNSGDISGISGTGIENDEIRGEERNVSGGGTGDDVLNGKGKLIRSISMDSYTQIRVLEDGWKLDCSLKCSSSVSMKRSFSCNGRFLPSNCDRSEIFPL